MNDWGFTRDEVTSALDAPEIAYDHERDDRRVVAAGRVRVAYCPDNSEVITVMPREDYDKEQPMSGWVNLDAKQAEKLLVEWGFEIHSTKSTSNLWHHPLDRSTLIPFSIPARGAKANGKGSFRTAANVVGRSVNEFLKGPDEAFKARVAVLSAADDALDLATGPDPLGINRKIGLDRLEKLGHVAEALMSGEPTPLPPSPTAQEAPVPYSSNDEKVLGALLAVHEPVASFDIANSTGLGERSVRESLRRLEKAGDAFRVGEQPSRGVHGGGRPSALWWIEATYTAPEPATAPEPVPTPAPEPFPTPIQETPVPDAAVIDLTQPTPETPEPVEKAPRLFTETGTPWPTGGILIQDEDGAFYVARKLVEEGR